MSGVLRSRDEMVRLCGARSGVEDRVWGVEILRDVTRGGGRVRRLEVCAEGFLNLNLARAGGGRSSLGV